MDKQSPETQHGPSEWMSSQKQKENFADWISPQKESTSLHCLHPHLLFCSIEATEIKGTFTLTILFYNMSNFSLKFKKKIIIQFY